ncbi:MAG: right-handed parallel beta-helix repeat-containing protein [bacterium]
MPILKNLLLLTFLSLFSGISISETYYFSNYGSDANNGLSAVSPKKSITNLNLILTTAKPGDVILFERGSYFSGQITIFKGGNERSPLIFGAYGEGNDPVISGAIPVTKWNGYNDEIYSAPADTVIQNVFAGGQQMTLARYPNIGFLKITGTLANPKSGFKDDYLKNPNGYFDGANVRLRTINWAYEHSPVKSYSDHKITFETETYYPAQIGWGYYFDNLFSELDNKSEWYYKNVGAAKGTLYFIPPENIDPQNAFIEGSVYAFGFYCFTQISNVIIRDLEIKGQTVDGIFFQGINKDIKIENCTFKNQMKTGITFVNETKNLSVNNCRFYSVNGKAIYLLNTNSSVISNNIFRNTGMIPGYGTTGDAVGNTALLLLYCNNNHVFQNNFNYTGHDGINCIGTSNVIEKNVLSNSLQTHNDGAAIKSYDNKNEGTVWNNNFIFNVPGSIEASNESNYYACGIYLDEFCSSMKVMNNTIVNCKLTGINLYNSNNNNLISGNNFFDNNSGIFFFKTDLPMTGNVTSGNYFYGLKNSQIAIIIKAPERGFLPGSFDNNHFYYPFNNKVLKYQISNRLAEYTLDELKKIAGNNIDANSVFISGSEVANPKVFKNMNNDTALITPDPDYNFLDNNLKSVSGTIMIAPYSSVILFADRDVTQMKEINIAGGPLELSNEFSPVWYNVITENLTSPVVVNAPDGFMISLTADRNYSQALTLQPVKGKVDDIIFVKVDDKKEGIGYGSVSNVSGDMTALVQVRKN